MAVWQTGTQWGIDTLLPVSLHNRGFHRVSPRFATLSVPLQHLPGPWSYSHSQDDSEFQADLLQLSLVSRPLSELPEWLDLKEIKFESWFLGPQTLYLKQQSTSSALEGRKLRGAVPSKCIVNLWKIFYFFAMKWNGRLIFHAALTGVSVYLCQLTG